MKSNLLLASLVTLAVATGSSQLMAWCLTPSCHLEQALKDLDAGKITTSLQNYCRKGEASTATFSVRSFNGLACGKYATQAAGYLAICSKVLPEEEFKNAQCFKKALKKLDLEEPTDEEDMKELQKAALEKLKEGIQKGQDKALGAMKKLACGVFGDKLSMICPKEK